ncbi:IS110 family transposase [Saccharothrix algeriensis]|uniref:Mini-circle putative transposase for IS117 n=2 Tax=Catellatospora bangladeshensis TaxID=310355 RepID=A0A8J3NMC8_9ACTN|nr:mini-circle putative transposase for IS117 [Catellatospora bangladeshensis]
MPMRFWAGLDWGVYHHDLAVTDDAGNPVVQLRVTNDLHGLNAALNALREVRRNRRSIPIAIETGRGLMVAGLRQAGQTVVVLNPTRVANYRNRWSAQPKKSDRQDALLLANILRVDGHVQPVQPQPSVHAQAVQEMARAHRRTVQSATLTSQRLRSLLHSYFPAAVTAWAGYDGGITRREARVILSAAPTPTQAARLTPTKLRALLVGGGRIRLVAAQADRLHALFTTRQLRQPVELEETMGQIALTLLHQLDTHLAIGEQQLAQLQELFDRHPHAEVYRSFPGMGTVLAARMLGELGDDLSRFPDPRSLRSFCAAVPITWASGTATKISHRRKVNPVLATIGYRWAFSALTRSQGVRDLYDHRRGCGDGHAAALRRVYARLLNCLHHCLRHATVYDEDAAFPATADEG